MERSYCEVDRMIYFLLIPIAGVLFAGVLLWRAVAFVPPKRAEMPPEELPVDRDRAVEHLGRMIRCKTVSSLEGHDEEEFPEIPKPAAGILPRAVRSLGGGAGGHHRRADPLERPGER